MRLSVLLAALLAFAPPAWGAARIKDVASLQSERQYQLIGYGLVVGLQGTGDTLRNVPFTEQSIQSMLDRMGVNIRGASLRNRNVAAVIVTAELPSGGEAGQRQDMHVSIQYQTVNNVYLPSTLNMDVVGTGTFSYTFDGCSTTGS